MIEITDNNITMTRGDTLVAQLTLVQNNEAYTPVEGDVITFEAHRLPYDDGEAALEKTIDNSTLLFELEPDDTADLDCGEYSYKMKMTFANGDVDTFISGASLTLAP